MYGPRQRTGKPSPRRKTFPYYKVYVYSECELCWVEARVAAFDTLDEARAYVLEAISPAPARIVAVEETGRTVIEDTSPGGT